MDRSTPASDGATAPEPDDQAPRPQAGDSPAAPDRPESKQTEFFGFYAVVVGMAGNPPDRALYREALRNVLDDGPETFDHCGYRVSRRTVANIARAFYFRTNRAGAYVPDVPPRRKRPKALHRVLAEDAYTDSRAVKAALWVMAVLRIARHVRPRQRNRPAQWLMNLGSLDWPMVRERVLALRAARSVVSPVTPRKTSRGVTGDTTERSIGVRTVGQQQQQPLDLLTAAAANASEPPPLRPTERQLRGLASMGAELRRADVEPDGPDNPASRAQADETFSKRKAQIAALRSPRRAVRPTEGHATLGRVLRRCGCGGFVRSSGRVAEPSKCDKCGGVE